MLGKVYTLSYWWIRRTWNPTWPIRLGFGQADWGGYSRSRRSWYEDHAKKCMICGDNHDVSMYGCIMYCGGYPLNGRQFTRWGPLERTVRRWHRTASRQDRWNHAKGLIPDALFQRLCATHSTKAVRQQSRTAVKEWPTTVLQHLQSEHQTPQAVRKKQPTNKRKPAAAFGTLQHQRQTTISEKLFHARCQ